VKNTNHPIQSGQHNRRGVDGTEQVAETWFEVSLLRVGLGLSPTQRVFVRPMV